MRSFGLLACSLLAATQLASANLNAEPQTVLSVPDGSAASTSASSGSRKIAIIGSGPSGASAAYWLSRAQQKLDRLGRTQEGFELHLYEREERIGGRVKVTYPFDDKEHYDPVELGASIFADVNKNMQRAAKVSSCMPAGGESTSASGPELTAALVHRLSACLRRLIWARMTHSRAYGTVNSSCWMTLEAPGGHRPGSSGGTATRP